MLHLERRARDKHSSLLQKSVNYGQKRFITLAPEIIIVYDEDVPFSRISLNFKLSAKTKVSISSGSDAESSQSCREPVSTAAATTTSTTTKWKTARGSRFDRSLTR